MARKCFYSFHYDPDNWRAGTVRGIGAIEGNKPASDNDWEAVTGRGDKAIKDWIANQINGRTCTVVLVGNETANRKWINHEIVESWNKGMGVVGIRIHGLLNSDGYLAKPGHNPFRYINHVPTGNLLSSIVRCYDPEGSNSKERYAWIKEWISAAVEEAIDIRKQNQ